MIAFDAFDELGTITFDVLYEDEVAPSADGGFSDSFSGDDDGSLEPTSCVTGLYGGIVLTLPPFFCENLQFFCFEYFWKMDKKRIKS